MDQFPIKHKNGSQYIPNFNKKTIKRERISKFCVGSSFLLLHTQVLCFFTAKLSLDLINYEDV